MPALILGNPLTTPRYSSCTIINNRFHKNPAARPARPAIPAASWGRAVISVPEPVELVEAACVAVGIATALPEAAEDPAAVVTTAGLEAALTIDEISGEPPPISEAPFSIDSKIPEDALTVLSC